MTQIILGLIASGVLTAGPFAPPAGEVGSDAVAADDAAFVQWANGGTVSLGRTDITSTTSPEASFGTIADALGVSDAEGSSSFPVVSLGDGGSATLTFARAIQDVPGPDFAVFENGFIVGSGDVFLELSHVEVSSDGVDFYRFPSVSLTQKTEQKGIFGTLDATDLHNLAGKYEGGFGTPFDLAEMKNLYPFLDTQRITHVRVIDVVGSIDRTYGTEDSLGNLINDPFKTNFNTGGFDLDAIGAFSQLPANFSEWLQSQGRIDSSPTVDFPGIGVPQLIEYFTGGSNVKLEQGVSQIGFDWLSYRTDRDFWIEGSGDLDSWEVLAKSTLGGAMTKLDPEVSLVVTGGRRKELRSCLAKRAHIVFSDWELNEKGVHIIGVAGVHCHCGNALNCRFPACCQLERTCEPSGFYDKSTQSCGSEYGLRGRSWNLLPCPRRNQPGEMAWWPDRFSFSLRSGEGFSLSIFRGKRPGGYLSTIQGSCGG